MNFGHLWAFFFRGPLRCAHPYHTQQVRLPISFCCGAVSRRLRLCETSDLSDGEGASRSGADRIGREEGGAVHAGGPADEDAEAGEGPRQARAQVGSRPWKSQCSRYDNLSLFPSLAVSLHLHFSNP